MEKINGGTLESFIKFNKKQNKLQKKQSPEGKKCTVLHEEIAASIAKDICNGLFMIHKKNFIHRDLKPENILIHEKEDADEETRPEDMYTAKIADFGLSAEVHQNVFHGSDNINEIMGTILFMAPEQATGQRYGKRIDVWAVGIIVF
jgi:serine/threonine protein kinase